MLRLIVEHTHEIPLPDDFAVRIRLRNPMWHKDGSYSLPFTLPASPETDTAFAHYGRLSRKPRSREFNFQLLWDHLPIIAGSCVLSKRSNRDANYTGYLKPDTGKFNSAIRDRMLSDLEAGGKVGTFTSVEEWRDFLHATLINDNQNFIPAPVYNANIFDQAQPYQLFHNFINVRTYTYPYYPQVFPGLWPTLEPQVNYSFHPYLTFLLQTIFREHGYDLIDDFFKQDADLSKLVLFSMSRISYNNPDMKEALPHYLISDFITDLEDLFNISVFPDDKKGKARIRSNQEIIEDTACIDYSHQARIVEVGEENKEKGFHLEMSTDGEDDYIISEDIDPEMLKEAVDTTPDLPSSGDRLGSVRLVRYEMAYYIFKQTGPTTQEWVKHSDVLQKFYKTREYLKKTTGASYMHSQVRTMEYEVQFLTDDPNKQWRAFVQVDVNHPRVDIPIVKHKKVSPRLAFYRGLRMGDNFTVNSIKDQHGSVYDLSYFAAYVQEFITKSGYYPLLSESVWDHDITKIAEANLSLHPDGLYSIFSRFWEKYIEKYLNRRSVTVQKTFTPAELADFRFDQKFRINQTKLLASEVELNLTKWGILPSTISAYKF